MPDFVKMYGKKFDLSLEDENGYQVWDPLGIEFFCILEGKEWVESQGRTLEFHYENVRRIIWPELDVHRWHTLCTHEIVNHKITVLMGPGSSGKTHEASWIGLVNYWLRPHQTCVLVASTHLGGLKKRVWAEINMLWQQGIERFPKLAGHLLDSAIAITTDNVEDCDPGERKIRDMRKGIFGVACFPTGTLVDTQTGKIAIEQIKVGDVVINATGVGRVSATMSKIASRLVRVKLSDGRVIDCTEEHPFFTRRGWVKAVDLQTYDMVFSADETLRLLRPAARSWLPQQKTLQRDLQKISEREKLRTMREIVSTGKEEKSKTWEVLQHNLRESLDFRSSTTSEEGKSEVSTLRHDDVSDYFQSKVLLCELPKQNEVDSMPPMRERIPFNSRTPSPATDEVLRKILQAESNWQIKRQTEDKADIRGNDGLEFVPRIDTTSPHTHRPEKQRRSPALVSAGHRLSENKISGGSGRRNSFPEIESSERCQADKNLEQAWVDSVEVLQPSSDERHAIREGGYLVHNLEVESHPSYSVNGCIVHNCITGGKFVGLSKFVGIKQKYMILLADEASMMGETFLSAFSNLNKNENFQAIVMGNPNDPLDPLGRAAEPKEGWTDDYMEPKKTMVWDTRFMNGRCVNLIGLDSPNFDFPADKPTRYKYLISHEKIQDTLSFFPKDSMEYYSQCVGSMKIGTIARRVLSRVMVKENHAQDMAVWRDVNRTLVYFVDSSYGGDRCVAGYGEFGADIDGKQILSLSTPKIIPILIGKGIEPEDQIARFVKFDCETEGIQPENMGHDATGRGSLGTSLAREWSPMTNPIDAGGRPTKRPVSLEITILDPETGQKRPKRCDEHYDRLVSEFWFSVRYAVESGQIRGLCDEAVEELCARKWDRIRGDKYAVEVKDGTPTKPGMKQRTGKSPDIGDWVAGVVEMARRKGFVISKLGNPEKNKPKIDDYFKKEAERIAKFNRSRQLQTQ